MNESEDFPEDGAIVCSHVFAGTRPALLAIRSEEDGILQILCGQWDHDDSEADEAKIVGVAHLVDKDPTLAPIAELDAGYLAERENASSEWVVEPFDDEEEDEEDDRDNDDSRA